MSGLIAPALATEPIVTFAGVTYRYPERDAPALSGFDWAVAPGEFVTVIGHSGCGKSTLGRTVMRLEEPRGAVRHLPRRR